MFTRSREGHHIVAAAVGVMADAAILPDEAALGADGAAAEQLRDHVDEAAAAEARGLLPRLPHHVVDGLQSLLVQGDALNGAGGGTHAAADLAALEGGAGRAGAGEHKVPVSQHQLPIGAQINEEDQIVLIPKKGGEEDPSVGQVPVKVGQAYLIRRNLPMMGSSLARPLAAFTMPMMKRMKLMMPPMAPSGHQIFLRIMTMMLQMKRSRP